MIKRTVSVESLRVHPAQMRTRMDLEEMAQLVLQVHTRGLDEDRPIVVASGGDGTYRIVKGHRRWLATMFAAEAGQRAKGEEISLASVTDLVREFASRTGDAEVCALCGSQVEREEDAAWCPECESWVDTRVEEMSTPVATALPEAYVALMERHADLALDVLVFEGDEKQEILALQADNFGQEPPDLLGQARSFAAADRAGAAKEEIAANSGLSVARVKALLALNRLPDPLAEAVAEGDVPLGMAPEVARLKKRQQGGASRFVLECEPTVEDARRVMSRLRKWQPPAVSLDPELAPTKRNSQRLTAALWARLEKEDPDRAWFTAARAILLGRGLSPGLLDGDGDERASLRELVAEASCDDCRLRELLLRAREYFHASSHWRYPCQAEEEPQVCLRGVFGQDPFWLEVPYSWQEYPGVEWSRSGYGDLICRSAEAFEQALAAAQAACEGVEGEAGDADAELPWDQASRRPGRTEVADVAGQRRLIRSYMEQHAGMSGAAHPLATRCEDCRHRLDGSPTRDPGVPACQWAARRRNVEFWIREPLEGERWEIPLCRQYGPTRSFDEAVPEHPAPPGVPREWMLGLMRQMVEDVERHKGNYSSSRLACEILTGRPMKASEGHKGVLLDALQNEIGDLSDGQLWTLAMWVSADWMRDHDGLYLLPFADGRVMRYRERGWAVPEVEGEEGE